MIIINGYEFEFGYFQIDITGRCNLRCKHCRAEKNKSFSDLPLEIIEKVTDFGIKGGSERMTISGGEPLLHPHLKLIIRQFKKKGGDEIVITSNGLLLDKEIIDYFSTVSNLRVQISIDSPIREKHDAFRGSKGAYNRALFAVRELVKNNINTSIRCTVGPNNIEDMEGMIKLALREGVKRISLGLIIATGAALQNNLVFTPIKKKKALLALARLSKLYENQIEISNEDPLKCHFKELIDINPEVNPLDEDIFGGCNAGLVGFYCSPDGIIQACSLLPIEVLDVRESKNIYQDYCQSEILKDFVNKKFKGKCGQCFYRRICGGCRANAYGMTGDYLESDPTCWEKIALPSHFKEEK